MHRRVDRAFESLVVDDDIAAEVNEQARRLRETPDYWLESLRFNLKQAVAERMREMGWTNEEAAERAGLKPSGLSKMLNNDTNPTLRTVAKIAVGLGLRPELRLVC
ncbi:MAG: helix-turn-helix transcriptional regulator, partial [Candidatus Poribacteria bacterium]|nr:helix-turn-helix transcriptional regulator [Candidatus Poribacteria bacterium]